MTSYNATRLRSPRPSNKPHRSKSRLDQICFKLQRDMAILRREMASLRALIQPKPAIVDSETMTALEAAKQKRAEDRETAKREYAAFVAKQALIQPERDRARAEWEAKEASRKRDLARVNDKKWCAKNPEKANARRELNRVRAKEWRAANPEKAKAAAKAGGQRRKEKMAAQKQIGSGPDLLGRPS